jgi:DNA-binding NtrC family response regulator
VLLAVDGRIGADDLPLDERRTNGNGVDHVPDVTLEQLERRHIETILARTNWHQGRAATILGISSKTLYRKIREYGFQRPRGGDDAS